MPWPSNTMSNERGRRRGRLIRHRSASGGRHRLPPAMGAGAGGARAALSRGDGETQPERRRDPDAVRWRADDCRHRGRPRADLCRVRPDGGCLRVRRPSGGAHLAGAAPVSDSGAAEAAMQAPGAARQQLAPGRPGPPLWLLLELTYRCPLHCVFCYNPTNFGAVGGELETAQWLRVLQEARALGSVQLGLSGGEPLVREDLETIVAAAHRLGFYINLITSGVGLTEARLRALKEGGLDHIQLSFQDSTRQMNDFLSSTRTFELKSRVAALIKQYRYPMVLNVVLHRLNIDHVEEILHMAERMGAEYVELANTQYYGWAWRNREQLLPSRAQLRRAEEVTARFRERVGSRMRIFFVVPDYFETRPKPCMSGLGRVFLGIAPDGTALPCQAARMLPGLEFPSVREASIRSIWYDSPAFN